MSEGVFDAKAARSIQFAVELEFVICAIKEAAADGRSMISFKRLIARTVNELRARNFVVSETNAEGAMKISWS